MPRKPAEIAALLTYRAVRCNNGAGATIAGIALVPGGRDSMPGLHLVEGSRSIIRRHNRLHRKAKVHPGD
jgi:hypothetical protein